MCIWTDAALDYMEVRLPLHVCFFERLCKSGSDEMPTPPTVKTGREVSMRQRVIQCTVKALPGILALACCVGLGLASAAATAKSGGAGFPLPRVQQPWIGDYDGMVKRRYIRVLVVSSKTFYFMDQGTPRGLTYDAFKALEEDINKRLQTKHIKVHIVFIPVRRDQLLPDLVAGKGDIAAANLSITPERQKSVDFTDPAYTGVSEIVLTGPQAPQMAAVEDLAGREVFVRKSSSYYESLLKLNKEFERTGKPQVILKTAPEELEDEDLLEMLNAGLVQIVIVDSHKANFWQQVFAEIRLHPSVAVRSGGEIAWAIGQNSPLLKATLNEFIKTHSATTSFGAELFRRYLKNIKYVKNATSEAEIAKFYEIVKLFERYGNEYDMDALLIAAQGYQESRLDPKARSRAGAIGVMQVTPATGKSLKVGDITLTEPNIHAGTKYIRFMIDQYYKGEPMDDLNKGLFAFASYNAGPNRLRQLRLEAAKRGLNPNVWFNHVELVAAEKIGRETVQYVSNIYKYYIAYRLLHEETLAREAAKKQLRQQGQ
jgi:membrane-bound lytic murein transglycosylase MltF